MNIEALVSESRRSGEIKSRSPNINILVTTAKDPKVLL